MSEIPDDIRKIARSYVGHQHRWIGPDEVVTLLANAILIERLAAEKRGKEEAAKNASDYVEGIADQFDRLAADGGRKSKWNAILAENFHSIAAAIRGS